jgi:hypothetical protein
VWHLGKKIVAPQVPDTATFLAAIGTELGGAVDRRAKTQGWCVRAEAQVGGGGRSPIEGNLRVDSVCGDGDERRRLGTDIRYHSDVPSNESGLRNL